MSETLEDLTFDSSTEVPPLVPSGEYEVSFVRASRKDMWRQTKLFLWFVTVTPGAFYGTHLYMVCDVTKGKHPWGPGHKFLRHWILAAGRKPERQGRMTTKVFRNKIFLAAVRVVEKDANGGTRTLAQQYSVIDHLVELVAGPHD
ncbi:hypothetical protein DNFV4_02561 [Nitrospira tepida]|uniref:Uncharacterized protein n=2 Tax=Nitrospira tepida TaxID=2973512 RepID=A0AA86TCL5_9BACT|nr:hypothetical protein DNFV4_02561 [Nitrospira tepida]